MQILSRQEIHTVDATFNVYFKIYIYLLYICGPRVIDHNEVLIMQQTF